MNERGRTPDQVNERLITETFKFEAKRRKLFVDEAYSLFLDRLALDIDARDRIRSDESEYESIYTQVGRIDAYARGDGFQKAVTLLSMPEGSENIDETRDGNERLRVSFPVKEDFSFTTDDIQELIESDEPIEMHTEWSFWHEGKREIIRWVISEEKMIRYTSIGDESKQIDEIDEFEKTFKRFEGKRLATRGDVLSRIIEDFVNFTIQPQGALMRQKTR
jgi:hypothetical protein